MAVIDIFTYNGELDLLKLRLEILYPYVDRFIVCESKTTFTGNRKPLYFSRDEHLLKEFWPKLDYYIIQDKFSIFEMNVAAQSPNTQGAEHWKTEFMQKECLLKALKLYKAKDEDIVYVGDVDEIWEPCDYLAPAKLKLRVYAYYLNNRSDEEFWGTVVAKYAYLKDKILNHVRTDSVLNTSEYHGWHFTSMGGYEEVKRKLDDSYSAESYNTTAVNQHLREQIEYGKDYLGRNFRFSSDESDWPEFLATNRERYQHLCK